jgi:phosphotransferase system HPr-like phosphotransfer protein
MSDGYGSAGSVSGNLLIVNKRGFHARAAARFVQCAETF